MKKKLFSLIVVLCFTLFQVHAQNSLDSGLVAYYPFNGNDSDYSTKGNHPIFNNAIPTTDRFGIENSAYSFNGNYMQIPNTPSINFNSTISLCAWVKVSGFYYGLCHGNMIMQKGDNGTVAGQYQLLFSDANYTNGANCNGGIPDTLNQSFYGTGSSDVLTKIVKEEWYFLTVTYDGQYSKFYVNSKLKDIQYAPGKSFMNTNDLFFGRMNNSQYPYWLNGALDDIRIYNRAITRQEVRKLYTEVPTPTVVGNVYVDYNIDGIRDSIDYASSYTKVKLSNGDYVFTDYNGDYAINVEQNGDYYISIDPTISLTSIPAIDSFSIITPDTTITKDFRMIVNTTAYDSLRVNIIPLMNAARPGFSYPCVINYVNTGNTLLDVINNFVYDTAILQYDSSSAVGVIKNWNVLNVTSNQMYPGQRNVFIAYFTVKPTAHLGDSIKLYTTAIGGNANSIDSIWARIRGSYDPNEKDATPILSTTDVVNGKYIDYIIRFENTGTDTAFRVVVTDVMSNYLDLNSIQLTAVSHNCNVQVNDNKVSFIFNNINLPYTTINKIASHGYIAFRIKPKASVSDGTDIPNNASIYFDYNLPIVTNTAITKIRNIVLPVKLFNYDVKLTTENQIVNSWKTLSEINTSYFNIQRSINGKNFETIGKVNAGKSEYNFTDNNIPATLNNKLYYRLQIVDKDGSIAYSEVKFVAIKNQSINSIVLYPNPATNEITISRSNNDEAIINIVDIAGKTVKTVILNSNKQTIAINDLPKGIYAIVLQNKQISKFIKE